MNNQEPLLEEQEVFIKDKLIKERNLFIKIGIIFFLLALIGPLLPSKYLLFAKQKPTISL